MMFPILLVNFGYGEIDTEKGLMPHKAKLKLKTAFIDAFNISEENWSRCFIDFDVSEEEIKRELKEIKHWKNYDINNI